MNAAEFEGMIFESFPVFQKKFNSNINFKETTLRIFTQLLQDGWSMGILVVSTCFLFWSNYFWRSYGPLLLLSIFNI